LEPLGTETSAYPDSLYASHQNNINKINIDKMIKFFSNKVNNKEIRHPETFENAMKDINDLYVHLQPKVSPEQFAEKFVKDKKFRKEIKTLINELFVNVKDKPKSRQYANVMLLALELESAAANLTDSGINVDIKLSEGITEPIQTIV
jgi:lipoate-protein ligase A